MGAGAAAIDKFGVDLAGLRQRQTLVQESTKPGGRVTSRPVSFSGRRRWVKKLEVWVDPPVVEAYFAAEDSVFNPDDMIRMIAEFPGKLDQSLLRWWKAIAFEEGCGRIPVDGHVVVLSNKFGVD